MDKNAKIVVFGHRGLVGSALVRRLKQDGYTNLVTRTRDELDLLDKQAVETFFADERPEYVFLAAAKVGGIMVNNTYPADFIYQNLLIETNILHAAHTHKVKKLLFLGSSCIYPRLAPQPMKEEHLLTGGLEATNAPYAIAKIAGIIMCQSYWRQYGDRFISVMPTNLYGPEDNFHPEHSHVLPALIRKFHEAKEQNLPEVTMWGTGSAKREFLYVDDLASAVVFLMNNYDEPNIVNIGTGVDVSIKELAEKIAEAVGYQGKISWDPSKPDGTPRKLLDVRKINDLGWRHETELDDGIRKTYEWYKDNLDSVRSR